MPNLNFQRSWIGVASVIALTLAGCGKTTKAGYPQKAVDSFVQGCVGSGFEYAEEVCQCTIDKIQGKYSFDEFSAMNKTVQDGGKLPTEVLQLTGACYSEVSKEKGGPAYPKQVTDNFMNSCTAGSEDNAKVKKACECALGKIQEKYPFEEFMAIDRAASEGGEPPKDFTEILTTCFQEAG